MSGAASEPGLSISLLSSSKPIPESLNGTFKNFYWIDPWPLRLATYQLFTVVEENKQNNEKNRTKEGMERGIVDYVCSF